MERKSNGQSCLDVKTEVVVRGNLEHQLDQILKESEDPKNWQRNGLHSKIIKEGNEND